MEEQVVIQNEIDQIFGNIPLDYDSNVNILDAEEKIIRHKNILQRELFKILTEIRLFFKRKQLIKNHVNLSKFYALIKSLNKCKKKYVILYQRYLDLLRQQLENLIFKNRNELSAKNNSDIDNVERSLKSLYEKLNELQQINEDTVLRICYDNKLVPIKYIYSIDIFLTRVINNDVNLVAFINRLGKKLFDYRATKGVTEEQKQVAQLLENVKKSKKSTAFLQKIKRFRFWTVENSRGLNWLRYSLIGASLLNVLLSGIQTEVKMVRERVDLDVFMQSGQGAEYKAGLEKEVAERIAEATKDFTQPGDEYRIRHVTEMITNTSQTENSRKIFEFWQNNAEIIDVKKNVYKWSTANWYGAGVMMVYDDALSFLEKVKGIVGLVETVEHDLADGTLIHAKHHFKQESQIDALTASKNEVKRFISQSDLASFEREMEIFKHTIVEEQVSIFEQEQKFIKSFVETSEKAIKFKRYSEKLFSILLKDIESHLQDDKLFLITNKEMENHRIINYDVAIKLHQLSNELFSLKKKFTTSYNIFLTTIEPQMNYALDMDRFEEQLQLKELHSVNVSKEQVEFMIRQQDIKKGFAELKRALLEFESIPFFKDNSEQPEYFQLGPYLKIIHSLKELKKIEKKVSAQFGTHYRMLSKISMKEMNHIRSNMKQLKRYNAITKRQYLGFLLSGGETYTGGMLMMVLSTQLIFLGSGGLNFAFNILSGPVFEFITNYNPRIIDLVISKNRILVDDVTTQLTKEQYELCASEFSKRKTYSMKKGQKIIEKWLIKYEFPNPKQHSARILQDLFAQKYIIPSQNDKGFYVNEPNNTVEMIHHEAA